MTTAFFKKSLIAAAVTLASTQTFAAAFQCKAGSPMARTGEQQVVIW